VTINHWRTHFDTVAPSFSSARAALIRALEKPDSDVDRAEVSDALRAYRVAGKSAVIPKFYQAIDYASDPFDQVELNAAASYAEAFFDSDPLVRAGEDVLAGRSRPSDRELHEESFAQRQRCLDELRRIRHRKAKR
jgi:hypothetical protein